MVWKIYVSLYVKKGTVMYFMWMSYSVYSKSINSKQSDSRMIHNSSWWFAYIRKGKHGAIQKKNTLKLQ